MIYRFFLDSTLIDEPVGTGELTDSLRRDRNLKGLLRTQDVTITFIDSGYKYLKRLWDATYDSEAVCVIEQSDDEGGSWKPYYKGIVFCAEIEWDEKRGFAKVKIQDNSFNARINNNKSIKIFPSGGKSKNGVTITAPTIYVYNQIRYDQDNCSAWTDDAGSILKWQFYKVVDVLDYMVRWMTDNEMAFSCPDLTAGWVAGVSTQTQYLTITTGRTLRKSYNFGYNDTNTDFIAKWPGLDFQTLLSNVCKVADFSFIIDYSGVKPTFLLARETDFRSQDVLATFEDIEQVKTKTDISRIPAKIVFGSSQVTSGDALWATFPERLPLVGWNQEEFALDGKSNINAAIDLKLDFITSTNMIKNAIDNLALSNDDSNDKEFHLIMGYTTGGFWYPTQTDWITGSTYCFFNELLTNGWIVQRSLGGIPSGILSQLASLTDIFRASYSANVSAGSGAVDINPAQFNDDSTSPNNDGGGNYDTAAYKYTVPANGVYSFHTHIILMKRFTRQRPIRVYIQRLDSGLTLINNIVVFQYERGNFGFNPITNAEGSATFYCDATDIIRVKIELIITPFSDTAYIMAGSYFECIQINNAGSSFHDVDIEDFAAFRHEFEYPVSVAQWNKILSNPRGVIEFSMNGTKVRKGWIEEIKYPAGKNARIVLNSTKKLNK